MFLWSDRIKQEVDMSASWMVNGGDEKPATVVTAEACSTGALPTVTSAATQEQVFRFYWLDAYEDYFKHPGTPPTGYTLFLVYRLHNVRGGRTPTLVSLESPV